LPLTWDAFEQKWFVVPEGSVMPEKPQTMFAATFNVLKEIAKDVREGLLETVGVDSEFSIDKGRASVLLKLPSGADTAKIAHAIGLENADAWCDESGRLHLGINPWFSTKDTDQTVLCAIKVIHVLLGLHAVPEVKASTLKQRIIRSISEILQIQQKIGKR
jgi:hypothetical protein